MLPQTKLISFFIPTRSRKELLTSCIETLIRQIPEEKRKLVELILRLDTDDPEANETISNLPHDKIDIQVIIGYRGNGYKDGYIWCEECARLSRGTFLALWNDDAKFATDDWFNIFVNRIQSERNIFSYWFSGPTTTVKMPDGTVKHQEWPSFIFHHRKFWEILGYISGPGGVDSFIAYVLDPLGLFKKISEIRVDHTPWYEKPEETWDSVTKDNARAGQMVPTDFALVERSRQKIVDFVKNSKPIS